MRVVVCALAAVGAALVIAGGAPATVVVGVNDDAGKIATFSSWVYSTMQSEGLKSNTLTLTWDDTAPSDISAQDAVSAAIDAAAAAGISIELDLYPVHSQALSGGLKCKPSTDPTACGDTSEIQAFAAWAAQVAETFPTVHQFIVMNECNQPLFQNPQWNTAGQNQSAEVCGRALAAAYDAIKGVSKSDFVWGVGLSPRGNDNAKAVSNSSTSPVRFLGYLGAWFKAFAAKTHRKAPLMDGFDFHPYPVPQTLPFSKGYGDVDDAAVINLPRIYQAFYDGFKGTPQKTIGQQRGGGLPVSLNEVGIQTSPDGSEYVGTEVSAGPAGGVYGQYATPDYQSQWYLQMLKLVACDPNIRIVNIFHLIDEVDLAGWQSGLYYADQLPKTSATTVADWISQSHGNCAGKQAPWTPADASPGTPKPKPKPKLKPKPKPKASSTTTTTSKSTGKKK
jgi:hypothetical protein